MRYVTECKDTCLQVGLTAERDEGRKYNLPLLAARGAR